MMFCCCIWSRFTCGLVRLSVSFVLSLGHWVLLLFCRNLDIILNLLLPSWVFFIIYFILFIPFSWSKYKFNIQVWLSLKPKTDNEEGYRLITWCLSPKAKTKWNKFNNYSEIWLTCPAEYKLILHAATCRFLMISYARFSLCLQQ